MKGEKIPHNEKVFSLFKPYTEWISKGKAGVPVELGVRVCVLEDQYQFVLHHQVMWKTTDDKVALSMVTVVAGVSILLLILLCGFSLCLVGIGIFISTGVFAVRYYLSNDCDITPVPRIVLGSKPSLTVYNASAAVIVPTVNLFLILYV